MPSGLAPGSAVPVRLNYLADPATKSPSRTVSEYSLCGTQLHRKGYDVHVFRGTAALPVSWLANPHSLRKREKRGDANY